MTKDNVDDVVAYDKYSFSQTIINPILYHPSFLPKIFQLDKHYNINNIIIIGVNHVI
jgi:hypothetical protein